MVINKIKNYLIQTGFWIYKIVLGPAIHALGGAGFGCRYVPTCSQYAKQAFEQHSSGRALLLTLKRIIRCNPWIKRDVWDPVPHCCARKEHRAKELNYKTPKGFGNLGL